MSGRGEPAGCHGDALKGGLCARLSCAAPARIPGPEPPGCPGSSRLSPSGPARSGEAGAIPAPALPPQGLVSRPRLWGQTVGRRLFGVREDVPGAAQRRHPRVKGRREVPLARFVWHSAGNDSSYGAPGAKGHSLSVSGTGPGWRQARTQTGALSH